MHLAAQIGAYAAVAFGVFVLFLFCLANRTPAAPQRDCGDPACAACALLRGKWPKFQRPYSEREAMRVRKAVQDGRA